MANVIFSHPLITKPLQINVNPDQVVWAYGLNTAVYPTYGGEVVQILSVYFDDMQISGTVSTYNEIEQIYSWFITYMQYATQGRTDPSFDQHPVDFYYPERHWHFQLWPHTLPGFRYGRDVVAPTWSLTAAVREPDASFADALKDLATFNAMHKGQAEFGSTTADFGNTGDLITNPFASPDADPTAKGKNIGQWIQGQAHQQAQDFYNNFTQSYANNQLSKLPQFRDISKPPDYSGSTPPAGRSSQGKKGSPKKPSPSVGQSLKKASAIKK